jgi:outer membrane protein assembly factor BamA
MFNLNLGITLGILHHRVDWFRSNQVSTQIEYSSIHYRAVILGVTWRFLDRFRAALDMLIPFNTSLVFRDFTTSFGVTNHLLYDMDTPRPGFSLTFAVFIVDNLSLEVGYQFMFHHLKFKRDGATPSANDPFGQKLHLFSHRITFSAGYGFDL